MITTFFVLWNTIQFPFAYLVHTLALIQTITDSDETMDEFSEKMQRVLTIFKFIVAGPFILMLSIPVNGFVFFYNMYTKAHDADVRVDEKIFTKASLEIF